MEVLVTRATTLVEFATALLTVSRSVCRGVHTVNSKVWASKCAASGIDRTLMYSFITDLHEATFPTTRRTIQQVTSSVWDS